MAKQKRSQELMGAIGERALSRKEASHVTGYSEKHLATLASRGQGPPVRKYKRKCIYLQSEVLDWLKNLPVAGGGRAA